MTANLHERILRVGDYDNDGGIIDLTDFKIFLHMYDGGFVDAAAIKTKFGMTTAQGNDLDALLGTMPNSSLTLTVLGITVLGPNALSRAKWVESVYNVYTAGVMAFPPFDTVSECKTALGVA